MLNPPGQSGEFYSRAMRNSDLDLVVANEQAAYAHPWTKRIFVDCLRAGYQCWVLANKQQIAAHGVMAVAIGECHLLTLCVNPRWQRRGFGRKLFTLLLDRAYRMDAETCFLEVRPSNESAVALYKSMGFVQIGQRRQYYPGPEGREDALLLSCPLPLDYGSSGKFVGKRKGTC